MVSRQHRRRAAPDHRLREWRQCALPRGQRTERPRWRICWPLGRRGLGRPFRQPSREAVAIKRAAPGKGATLRRSGREGTYMRSRWKVTGATVATVLLGIMIALPAFQAPAWCSVDEKTLRTPTFAQTATGPSIPRWRSD